MSTQRHPNSAEGSRSKHGALACREYSLLALEEPTGNPDAAGLKGGGDSPKFTTGTGVTNRRETVTEEWNR